MPAIKYVCLMLLALGSVSCSGPTVVNTDESTVPPRPSASAAPTTTRPSNAHLANAYHFAAEVDGQTGYYFTSPSGRWECAIVPRVRAGCQDTRNAASIGITGAPDEVPGADGEPSAPNAIVVDRDADPQFVALATPAFGLAPDPAPELPFNRILAVAGFRCNVQESVGISCLSEASGKGFTFSADGFAAQYTTCPPTRPD
ncbi:hypothetical protein H7I42_15355 [Mycolicibacterium vanbaalenii PYR-1]|nr:hypothetical protein [Mycolicibacterium vanbaalenii]MCV7128574.1 hypothetical protein [Mycolicibacterium vanbaalenii PYR-1]